MTVRIADDGIHLEGHCPIEEAEPLLRALQDRPDDRVHCNALDRAHLAVVQLLLAAVPRLSGRPRDPLLQGLLS